MNHLPDAEELYQALLSQLKAISKSFHLAGLASGGAWVAQRLSKDLNHPTYGVINVSFHRDDYAEKGVDAFNSAQGMATKLPFEVENSYIVLVDDVLDTGRTVRAALNELFDYGRPARVQLAVLVDRGGRELPIQADFAAVRVALPDSQLLALARSPQGGFSFQVEMV